MIVRFAKGLITALLGTMSVAALTACMQSVWAAIPPGEQLVPVQTKFFITCRNFADLKAAGDRTVFGDLAHEELMQPFYDDLDRQIQDRAKTGEFSLGITLSDLKDLTDGQVTLAVIPLAIDEAGKPHTGTVTIIDVTKHEKQVQALRDKIAKSMADHNAQTTPITTPDGAAGSHYIVPPQEKLKHQVDVIEAIQQIGPDTVWIIGDEPDVVSGVSAALAGKIKAPLSGAPAFKHIIEKSDSPPGEAPAHIALFVDPLGLADALRAYEPEGTKHKPDTIAVLRGAGFDALQGVGGQATLDVKQYAVLVRAAALAPQPWQKSMNMLSFLPGDDFAPPAFVAADTAGYVSAYLDVLKAFDHFGPLFDGFLEDEGIWIDVLDSMKNDPDGPMIDLRADFFALLGKRVTAILDTKVVDGDPRTVIAAELPAANMAKVTEVLKRAFANDPSVKREKLGEFDVYEIIATEEVPANAPNQEGVVNGQRTIVSTLVTAANGYLFLASHRDILQKVLNQQPGPGLANQPDYVVMSAELAKFVQPQNKDLVGLGFQRLDELIRGDFEMFRAGKMPKSNTVLGRILDVVTRDQEGTREMKVDGSKLPPFEKIRKYLPPFGAVIRTTPDGWSGLGIIPQKAPQAAATQPAAAVVTP